MTRHGVGPGKVTVIMKDGEEYTEAVENCLGSVENPMNFEDCAKKFRECSTYFKRPLSSDTVEQMIGQIGRLELLDDATEIIKMLR